MTGKTIWNRILMFVLLHAAAAMPTFAADEQSVQIFSRERSVSAQAVSDGFKDYLQLINQRDGGINGIRLRWHECELVLDAEPSHPCSTRGNSHGIAIALPSSTSVPADWIERSRSGRIPLLLPAGGRPDAIDGRAFPFAFRLSAGLPSQAAAQISFIADNEGGFDRLRGKRIAYVHGANEDGLEVIALLEMLAAEHEFRLTRHAMATPAGDQLAIWRSIRRSGTDWVLLGLPGSMTAAALRAVRTVGLPIERVIGSASSASELHLVQAGEAAIGFTAVASTPTGGNFGVLRAIRRHIDVTGRRGPAGDPALVAGSDYLLGVSHGLLVVESIRLAQRRFGVQRLGGEQLRWGLERLQLDEERLSHLGANELLPPITTSCVDHEGSGAVKFQRWLGNRWNVVTDWISGDRALMRRLVATAAVRRAGVRDTALRACEDE